MASTRLWKILPLLAESPSDYLTHSHPEAEARACHSRGAPYCCTMIFRYSRALCAASDLAPAGSSPVP